VIEEGTYRAKSRRAQLGMTGTGKEQVGIEWLLLDGTDRRITSYHYFSSDKAIEISMEALRNAGFRGMDLSDLSSLTDREDTPTPECELVIVHEEYNGKTSAKVRFVNAGGGLAMANPLDQSQAKAFAARMRGAIAAFDSERGKPQPFQTGTRAPNGGRASTQPPPAGAYAPPEDNFMATDEDVPF
jgi:hypothetical protein